MSLLVKFEVGWFLGSAGEVLFTEVVLLLDGVVPLAGVELLAADGSYSHSSFCRI